MGGKIKRKLKSKIKKKMVMRPLPKILVSYGCQVCILQYYSDSRLEVLKLQLINRNSYGRLIARC